MEFDVQTIATIFAPVFTSLAIAFKWFVSRIDRAKVAELEREAKQDARFAEERALRDTMYESIISDLKERIRYLQDKERSSGANNVDH